MTKRKPLPARVFEPGCLVFERSDIGDPLQAIGVTFAPAGAGRSGLAVMSKVPESRDTVFYARDSSGAVPVRVVETLKPQRQAS